MSECVFMPMHDKRVAIRFVSSDHVCIKAERGLLRIDFDTVNILSQIVQVVIIHSPPYISIRLI